MSINVKLSFDNASPLMGLAVSLDLVIRNTSFLDILIQIPYAVRTPVPEVI